MHHNSAEFLYVINHENINRKIFFISFYNHAKLLIFSITPLFIGIFCANNFKNIVIILCSY